MAKPWTWLTLRGKAVAGIGVALAAGAVAAGLRDILVVAVFLLALPLVALLSLMLSRPRLRSQRHLLTPQVTLGQSFCQRIDLERSRGPLLGTLLLEDRIPAPFGAAPRFAVAWPSARSTRQLAYELPAAKRGRFQLGPLSVHTHDPFGMARLRRSFTDTSEVLVLPKVAPLSDISRATAAGLAGIADRIGASGSDDVMVREYRTGDDVRRIHWRSSARNQQLMVRREEQARDLHVTLITDTRAHAHTGSGPNSTLEWVVSMAASIGVHCVEENFALTLLTPTGELCERVRPLTVDHILVAFAELTPAAAAELPPVESAPTVGHKQGLVVVVTGRLTEADAQSLLRTAGSQSGAVIACTTDGADDRPHRLLEAAGWHVVRAAPRTSPAAAWIELVTEGAA